jgi:hypothetical protein
MVELPAPKETFGPIGADTEQTLIKTAHICQHDEIGRG